MNNKGRYLYMKNKNKNGFTLIELLAVIIILIIVIFIAITKVRNSSLKAQLDAMKANAGAYIKAVNNAASNVNIQEDSPFESGLLRYSVLSSLDVNVTGTKPSDGYVIMGDYEVIDACFEYGDYYITYDGANVSEPSEGNCSLNSLQREFAYTSSVQKFTVEKTGKYKIELWGAQGGQGANGGYTTGDIELTAGTNLYFFVGGEGPSNQTVTNVGGYNGGGYSGNNGGSYSYGGGGATDVRLVNSTWNNAQSLRSRIMVAGGGGGTFSIDTYTKIPGVGGNVNGGDADGSFSAAVPGGGKQTGPGTAVRTANQGLFGQAAQAYADGFGGGGGGGYWGGSMGYGRAGGGGSSYISGYQGCVAVISEDSNSPRLNSANTVCTEDTSDLDCSYHYSGYTFTNPDMKSGEESMPTHDGSSTMIGNRGNGYAKITFLNGTSTNVYAYYFTKEEATFTAPKNGTYKLEVWGAEGGTVTEKYYGGYGGYSTGNISLNKGDKLYVQVGGKGFINTTTDSYNGGGYGTTTNGSSGGGATSITLASGELSAQKKSNVIIVAGGGGGSVFYNDGYASGWGGHGGGYIGNDSTPDGWSQGGAKGGTQTEGGRYGLTDGGGQSGNNGSFGKGGNTSGYSNYAAGGGGGFYGGGSGRHASGAGGSGYIASSRLSNKGMYCYNCAENDDEDTKTTTTTCVNSVPTANCAKKGSGFARITLVN